MGDDQSQGGDASGGAGGLYAMAGTMMTVATDAAQAAMLMEVAPAIPIKLMFTLSTGNAENIDKAGQDWRQAAALVEQAAHELRRSVSGVSRDDWSANDRDAYERKVRQACDQLEVVHNFLEAAGIALSVAAAALFAYAVFAAAMGIALVAIGVAILACEATVVGSAAVPELEAAASVCLTITAVATGILAEVGMIVAMVLQGGAMLDAVTEKSDGNDRALDDLVNGEAVGLAGAGANLLQNAANAGIAVVNRRSGAPTGRTNEDGTPETEDDKTGFGGIDLDADRDENHTWDVAASGSYNDATAGGEVKWGDDGFESASGNFSYTPDDGPQVDANGSVEHKDGDWTARGDAGVEYEGADGQKYTADAQGEYQHNADGSSSFHGVAGGEYDTADGRSYTAGVGGGDDRAADGTTTYGGNVSAGYRDDDGRVAGVQAGGQYRQYADGGSSVSGGVQGRYTDGDRSVNGAAGGQYQQDANGGSRASGGFAGNYSDSGGRSAGVEGGGAYQQANGSTSYGGGVRGEVSTPYASATGAASGVYTERDQSEEPRYALYYE